MFEGFTPFDIETQQEPKVVIHGIKGPDSGPAIVLLHGFPQTHHIWHFLTPHLISKYTLVLIDLRGYGQSSKPAGTEFYAKSLMARDVAVVMEKLGLESYYVLAHDRGARVGHKLLVDFPEKIKKAIFLDICPTLTMFQKTDMTFAKAYWHWFFLAQPYPLPETVIAGGPEKLLTMFMSGRGNYDGLSIFVEEAWGNYVKGFNDPECVRGMCDDYRAAAGVDLEEARADIKAGKKIKSPLKVLWGKEGVIEKLFDGVGDWQAVSDAEVTGEAVEGGHYIPEENWEVLLKNVRGFFV